MRVRDERSGGRAPFTGRVADLRARVGSLGALVALLACNPAPPSSGGMATVPIAKAEARPASAPGTAAAQAVAEVAGLDALRVATSGKRIVAIGDVHGDLAATLRALRLAGAIGPDDADARWIGGDLVVVQAGDQLDRGDDEQAIVDLFETLATEARAAGGAFVVLNGNHEVMNVLGDLRYVTAGGFRDFEGVPGAAADDPRFVSLPAEQRARAAAFAPGGPYARKLAERHLAAIVGDTVFVHGGILPEQVDGLVALDAGVRAMMRGEAVDGGVAAAAMDPEGPLWARDFAWTEEPEVCVRLGESLAKLGVTRMVVGHTVQQDGINAACEGRVWRIDVGLAAHYGGPTQVLEIVGDAVRVLQ